MIKAEKNQSHIYIMAQAYLGGKGGYNGDIYPAFELFKMLVRPL